MTNTLTVEKIHNKHNIHLGLWQSLTKLIRNYKIYYKALQILNSVDIESQPKRKKKNTLLNVNKLNIKSKHTHFYRPECVCLLFLFNLHCEH